jgi:hypothetical protein
VGAAGLRLLRGLMGEGAEIAAGSCFVGTLLQACKFFRFET